MKALFLLLTWTVGFGGLQDPVKVGSIAFIPPSGWKAASSSGPRAAIFTAPSLAPGKVCQVTVYPDEISLEGARAWFDNKWTTVAAKNRQMLRMSEVSDQTFGPIQAILRSGAYKNGSGEGYVLLVGLAVEGHNVLASYDANDFALMEQNQANVFAMFDSFDLVTAGTSQLGKPASSTTITPKILADTKPQNPGQPMQDSAPDRLGRISEIARALQDPKSDAVALITEAAKLCGFAIWKEDRTKIADPTGSPPLHLAVTDVEIKDYAAMFRAGHSVALADLAGSVDILYKGLGATDSSLTYISQWLETGLLSNNPSVRALTAWVQDLGAYRNSKTASGLANGFERLDPIQALFVLRVVSEEICVPLRKSLRKSDPYGLLVSLQPEFQKDAPGWAGDAFTSGVTGLWESVISLREAEESTLGKVNEHAGRANAILSIIKFIATYCFLEGKLTVETPGQPLVRTKNLSPGDGTRTMVANFSIVGTRVTDWMKEHRELVALAGLDLDMPKSGALGGIETSWEVRQSASPDKKLIQLIRGTTSGIDKVKTDEKGDARVTWEGAPQVKALDPKKVMPVIKLVLVTVTPQVKEVEAKQDVLDATLGAIGISNGGPGFIQPLMETLYRMKWAGSVATLLQVRDWKEAETIGQFKIDIQAKGRFYDHGSYRLWTIDRLLEFSDVGMTAIGGEAPPPEIDANVLKNLSELERQQVLEGMKQMAELAKRRQFSGQVAGRAVMKIMDRSSTSMEGCAEAGTTSDTWTGSFDQAFSNADGDMIFEVFVDLDKKIATVAGMAGVKVEHVHSSKDGREPTRTNREEQTLTIFEGLEMKAPIDSVGALVIPLKETPVNDMPGATNYYGVETVSFTWGKGFQGKALISYSVTRKPKPKSPGLTFAEAQQLKRGPSTLAAFLKRQDLSPQMTQRTEAQELAMCYPTSVVLRGQLKHDAPAAKTSKRSGGS